MSLTNKDLKENIKKSLPPLPDELYNKFIKEFHLSEYDAKVLTEEKEIALFFDNICGETKNYKTAANIINGVITIKICHCTFASVFYNDVYTRDWHSG